MAAGEPQRVQERSGLTAQVQLGGAGGDRDGAGDGPLLEGALHDEVRRRQAHRDVDPEELCGAPELAAHEGCAPALAPVMGGCIGCCAAAAALPFRLVDSGGSGCGAGALAEDAALFEAVEERLDDELEEKSASSEHKELMYCGEQQSCSTSVDKPAAVDQLGSAPSPDLHTGCCGSVDDEKGGLEAPLHADAADPDSGLSEGPECTGLPEVMDVYNASEQADAAPVLSAAEEQKRRLAAGRQKRAAPATASDQVRRSFSRGEVSAAPMQAAPLNTGSFRKRTMLEIRAERERERRLRELKAKQVEYLVRGYEGLETGSLAQEVATLRRDCELPGAGPRCLDCGGELRADQTSRASPVQVGCTSCGMTLDACGSMAGNPIHRRRARDAHTAGDPIPPAASPAPAPAPARRGYTDEQAAIVRNVRAAGKDYYRVLEVPRDCDASAVKDAYRKLALKLHPDKNVAPGAEEAFKTVSTAYTTLSDADERAVFDRYGADRTQRRKAQQRRGNMADPGDVFKAFFRHEGVRSVDNRWVSSDQHKPLEDIGGPFPEFQPNLTRSGRRIGKVSDNDGETTGVVYEGKEAEESRDCPSLSGADKSEAERHQEAYARGRIALADAAENVTLSKNSEIKEMALFLHRCIHSTGEENRVCQACKPRRREAAAELERLNAKLETVAKELDSAAASERPELQTIKAGLQAAICNAEQNVEKLRKAACAEARFLVLLDCGHCLCQECFEEARGCKKQKKPAAPCPAPDCGRPVAERPKHYDTPLAKAALLYVAGRLTEGKERLLCEIVPHCGTTVAGVTKGGNARLLVKKLKAAVGGHPELRSWLLEDDLSGEGKPVWKPCLKFRETKEELLAALKRWASEPISGLSLREQRQCFDALAESARDMKLGTGIMRGPSIVFAAIALARSAFLGETEDAARAKVAQGVKLSGLKIDPPDPKQVQADMRELESVLAFKQRRKGWQPDPNRKGTGPLVRTLGHCRDDRLVGFKRSLQLRARVRKAVNADELSTIAEELGVAEDSIHAVIHDEEGSSQTVRQIVDASEDDDADNDVDVASPGTALRTKLRQQRLKRKTPRRQASAGGALRVAKKGKAAADDSERTMERLRGLCMQTIRRDEMYQRSGPRGEDLPKVKPKKTRITKSYSRLAEKFREKIAHGLKFSSRDMSDPWKWSKRVAVAERKARMRLVRTPAKPVDLFDDPARSTRRRSKVLGVQRHSIAKGRPTPV